MEISAEKKLPDIFRLARQARLLLPLAVLLLMSAATLKADSFTVAFTGSVSGTGQFSTDGICNLCKPGLGLLSLTVNLGPDFGPNAFDITDDLESALNDLFARSTDMLFVREIDSETNDGLDMTPFVGGGLWSLDESSGHVLVGSYSIAPVPETSSVGLLLSVLALVVPLGRSYPAFAGNCS